MKYLLCFMLSFNAMAIVPIQKNQPSPEDGYVITKPEEKKIRELTENNENKIKNLEQLGIVQQDIIQNQKKQVEHYKEYNDKLADQIAKEDSFWTSTGFFVLGAALTTIITYGAVSASKR